MKLILFFLYSLSLFSQSYSREDWMPSGWNTYQGCINVREYVLLRESRSPVKRDGKGCTILSGTWQDPYSGEILRDPKNVDIDHVVPLKWAHDHGGASWTPERKRAFANEIRDTYHLLVVSGKLNKEKGALGPNLWLPPKDSCSYIKNFHRIVTKWDLKYLPNEEKRIRTLLLCK